MDFIFSIFQLIGGIILSIGYIPQIIQIIKTKDVEGINSLYTLMVFVGCVCMEAYAIYNLTLGVAIMFFITNTISTLLSGVMFILCLIYKERW